LIISQGIFREFNLTNKIVTETTDAGANMKKAIVSSTRLDWINCLAHLLNLVSKKVVQDKRIETLLGKARKLVGCFKHSNSMMAKLKGYLFLKI
jgi:hypothetical protein